MAETYSNLPGCYLDLRDGGLSIFPEAPAPRVLVLGTAGRGTTGLYRVSRAQMAETEFGVAGTLLRGMYEAMVGGAANIYLMRIAAKPAKLEHIGDSSGAAGITVSTVEATETAGNNLKIFWKDSTKVLKIWTAAGVLVYDSTSGHHDTRYVQVVGTADNTTGADIGTENNPVVMSSVTAVGTKYTAGVSGLQANLMDLYEGLDRAYTELEAFDSDFVAPVGVYLDSPNIADDSSVVGAVTNALIGTGNGTKKAFDLQHKRVVPTTLVVKVDNVEVTNYTFSPGTGANGVDQIVFAIAPESGDEIRVSYKHMRRDALLYLRRYEEDGEYKYEWHTEKSRTVDGTVYTYHEVNFAHQLAFYCHKLSVSDNVTLGAIGVMPPVSMAASDVARWIGKPPERDNEGIIAADGFGLLGNKFMAGSLAMPNPGFWATPDGWLDQSVSYDVKVTPDIGRYLSIVVSFCRFFNAAATEGSYLASAAVAYAGLCSSLSTNISPTNKVLTGVTLPLNLSKARLDALTSANYVVLTNTDTGVTVVDAPTAATAASDFRRLTTIRIVTELVERMRRRLRPFIGQSSSSVVRTAMQTAADEEGQAMVSEGKLQRYYGLITATPAQQVAGEATLEVVVVPAFELRRIHLVVSITAA